MDNASTRATAAPELLPRPFCGSTNIDAAEWSGNDGASGPGCGDCGALADSAELWNRRAVPVPGNTGRIRKALEAALTLCDTDAQRAYFNGEIEALATREPAPVAREPVAWRYRVRPAVTGKDEEWCLMSVKPELSEDAIEGDMVEVEPLYITA